MENTASLSLDNDNNNASDSALKKAMWALGIFALVYGILLSVGMIGSGFKLASGGTQGARAIFDFATNPVMGLILGTFATALVQSSSTVTSVIVTLVAGGLPVSMAIPMIMGANIGTTVTNTIVSLGHVSRKDEFGRAFSAATIHDFFNLIAVIIFLPLEMAFGLLEKTSAWLTSLMSFSMTTNIKDFNFIKPVTKPVIGGAKDAFTAIGFGNTGVGIAMAIVGVFMIFASIYFLGKILKKLMVGKAKDLFHKTIGKGPVTGIASGTACTVLVQSSSTTTSLVVPMAGNGLLTLREVYPFTLGANIGTCVTALLVSMSFSGPGAQFALQIALVHLLFNVLSVLIIFGIPFLREIPIKAAEKLAVVASEKKLMALGYIIMVFFGLPGVFYGITRMMS